MDKKILQQAIKDNNPWWKEDFKINKKEIKERKIYPEIKNVFNSRQIIALTGLRRVGKTTLMKKSVADFLKKGYNGENILYFSFDEFSNIRIREILSIYEELQEKKLGNEKIVCLLDEIQKVENWQEQLKRIYDDFPKIKFIISGSESLFIKNSGTENLAGRIYEFKVNLLDFQEYLDFKNIDYEKIELNKEKIVKQLKKYFLSAGFPEIASGQSRELNLYVRSIIDKVIDSDMPKVFDIKNTSEVRAVFNIIYNNPGQVIEVKELGKELNLSRNKVSYILECLEKSFLIKKLYNFSKNTRKVERKLKKYYSYLINPYLIETDFGKIFENFVVINLNPDYFWRDSLKNEVDIVLFNKNKKSNNIKGIEVKSGEIKKKAVKPLKKFSENFKINKKSIMILSFDKEEEIEGIKVIPFYKYFLKC